MTTSLRSRVLAGAVAVPLLAGVLSACGDKEEKEAKAASKADCPSSISQQASTPLPADVPVPPGVTAYQYSSQGKTQVWFTVTDGSADDLVSLRDKANDALKAKGYKIEGTDQEEGAEAESEFSGPHEGSIVVRPLCSGKVGLRYKLGS